MLSKSCSPVTSQLTQQCLSQSGHVSLAFYAAASLMGLADDLETQEVSIKLESALLPSFPPHTDTLVRDVSTRFICQISARVTTTWFRECQKDHVP